MRLLSRCDRAQKNLALICRARFLISNMELLEINQLWLDSAFSVR